MTLCGTGFLWISSLIPAEHSVEGVDCVIIHVRRLQREQRVLSSEGEIDCANLGLADLDEENGCRVDDTLQHGDEHHDNENREHANFEISGLLSLL